MNEEIETTADGWGARFLDRITNTNDHWQRCLDAASRYVANNGSVILIGIRGTGKTRMAAEISRAGEFPKDLNDITGKKKTSAYRRVSEILMELRDSYRTRKGPGEGAIIKYLSGVGLLVIDEFQERGETEWENRMITTIIDRRYADNLPTILIANMDAVEIHQKLSDSVISRVNEAGGVIRVHCPSFREANAGGAQ